MSKLVQVVLKKGKEKALKNRHPWIFSGAVSRGPWDAGVLPVVEVLDQDGQFLALGYWNPKSQICVRAFSFKHTDIDEAFWANRVAAAIQRRIPLGIAQHANACRLIASEADEIPGLIVDQYDRWLVVQFLTAGIECHRDAILKALIEQLKPEGILSRSDDNTRIKEGLVQDVSLLYGTVPDEILIKEHGYMLSVHPWTGHKTGFYLDQRDARGRMKSYASGKHVLNTFAYTGGFSLAAHLGGAASIDSVDISADAMAQLQLNVARNHQDDGKHHYHTADVFDALRRYEKEGKQWDIIVLDPPKFVHGAASLEKACRGYKDINRLAFNLLRDGGYLFTFSCSGLMSADLFQKVVFSAAVDSNVDGQIIERFQQAPDHPMTLCFPESWYLKGLLVQVRR